MDIQKTLKCRQHLLQRVRRLPTGVQVFCRESRVGRAPVVIPKGVTATLTGNGLAVKGPKGEFTRDFPPQVTIELIENPKDKTLKQLRFRAVDESRLALSQHGLSRALANNMVVGASVGFEKRMEMVGTGYRASVVGSDLVLNCGYSKPRVLPIPASLTVKVEKQTLIIVAGNDKVAVGDFCATARRQRPPEPYKGKGIRFEGEVIKLKEGKAAGGKKK